MNTVNDSEDALNGGSSSSAQRPSPAGQPTIDAAWEAIKQ